MPSKEWVTVSLKRALVNELKKIAESKDIGHTTLINQFFEPMWIDIRGLHRCWKDVRATIVAPAGENK